MSQRHLARTIALQVISEWDFNHISNSQKTNLSETIDLIIHSYAPQDFNEQKFVNELASGVIKNLETIDQQLRNFAPEWPIDKITIIDRNVLRIGIFELLYTPNTPPKVVINEAIESAKDFGSANSPKFINGVLGAIYENLKNNQTASETSSSQNA
jgi:N utilization substance protein B